MLKPLLFYDHGGLLYTIEVMQWLKTPYLEEKDKLAKRYNRDTFAFYDWLKHYGITIMRMPSTPNEYGGDYLYSEDPGTLTAFIIRHF